MLMNVLRGHMTVTSMPIVTILWGPTSAPASQNIMETEKIAKSVSFISVLRLAIELFGGKTLMVLYRYYRQRTKR